jgi:hypothetical protein
MEITQDSYRKVVEKKINLEEKWLKRDKNALFKP